MMAAAFGNISAPINAVTGSSETETYQSETVEAETTETAEE